MADKLVKLREKTFQKSIATLEEELKKTDANANRVDAMMKVVHSQYQLYYEASSTLLAEYLAKNEDDKFLAQDEQQVKLQMDCDDAERKVTLFLEKYTTQGSSSRVNLPKLPLQEFTGDIRDWLKFKSSFDEVDARTDLSDSEKFAYLLKCLPEGSQARKAISGLPVMGKNYKNALKSLQSTFGRENTLVKFYMRELLQLASKKKDTMSLMEMVPLLVSQIRNLGELGVTTDKFEMVLYPVVESCLPEEVLKDWQRHGKYEEKINPLIEFLESEVQLSVERSLAQMSFETTNDDRRRKSELYEIPTASSLMNASGKKQQGRSVNQGNANNICIFCGDDRHRLWKCPRADQMSYQEKQEAVRRNNLCFCCLKPDHRWSQCTANIVCHNCRGKHFAIMCREGPQPNYNQRTMMMAPVYYENYPPFQQQQMEYGNVRDHGFGPPQQGLFPLPQPQPIQSNPPQENRTNQRLSQQANPSPNGSRVGSYCAVNGTGSAALMTLLIKVETTQGLKLARAFIDPGSEQSYILEKTADGVLKELVGERVLSHQVFGGTVTQPTTHHRFKIRLFDLNGLYGGSFVFNTVKTIASCIAKPPVGDWSRVLAGHGVMLHDQSCVNEDVQILFGVDITATIWTGGFIRLTDHLVARETRFGWVIEGEVQHGQQSSSVTTTQMVTSFLVNQLSAEDLWSLEVIGIVDEARTQTRADLETATVDFFKRTVEREDNGRYQVRMPWIDGHREIRSNRGQSIARLNNVTLVLQNDGYLQAYHEVFQGWLRDGIIEVVPVGEENETEYFLPHRHVIKEGSTTPVRPVFDASAKARGSLSLNDCLEKGPNWLERIPAIITRFRCKKYGAVADIKKAFLQMTVHPEDRKWVQFLWWTDTSCTKMQLFRHRRVVFGVKPSPFLLAATLEYHVRSEAENYPGLAEDLLKSFYVDNSVSCHDTMEEALEFKQKSVKLLAKAQMDLRGWEFGPAGNETLVPLLGLVWNNHQDYLCLELKSTLKKMDVPNTKRGLLAAMNSVYDPMGFAAPFTICAKFVFQAVCKDKGLKWDDPLPEEAAALFAKWKKEVPALKQLKVPRWMIRGDPEHMTLHVFSDASCAAFAACVYVRSMSMEGGVATQLIVCKSRLAPSNRAVTIPRLELLGCLLGARLAKEVKGYLLKEDIPVTFYTDSSAALAWITRDKQWATFVKNRVDEIRKLTNVADWRHLPGGLNPADVPSRGCSAERLINSQWWEGPTWLREPESTHPKSNVVYNEEEVEMEIRKTVTSAALAIVPVKSDALDWIAKYEDHHKRLRVMALVVRYCTKIKERVRKKNSGLSCEELRVDNRFGTTSHFIPPATVDEMYKAEIAILLYVQRTTTEFDNLKKKQIVPFVDEDNGLIRVKTNLFYGTDEYDVRCPVLLPTKHKVVHSIVWTEHLDYCHAPPMTTLSLLRRHFWVLDGRRTVTRVISKCPGCRTFTAKRCEVPGAPLPKDRVKDTTAFDVTGVDLFGPLHVKGGDKIWVVLFTCAVFRGIHLEIVTTLSTEGFLRALRRFVARRGRPSSIYSDNGLNFVGTDNLFQSIDWDRVLRYVNVQRIKWTFNPPTAAWWGGFWERLVGSCKRQLRRELGRKSVELEELSTILCDVEDVINRRPLTYMSENDTIVPLTPIQFMRDNGSSCLPEADVIDEDALRESAIRSRKIRESLRVRFRSEYLGQLKHMETVRMREVRTGDVVLIGSDDKKRIDWPIGLVKETYAGRDGKHRTALVKTKTGDFLRPIQRLYLLEATSFDSEISPVEESITLETPEVPCFIEDIVEEEHDIENEPVVHESTVVRTRCGRKIQPVDKYVHHLS